METQDSDSGMRRGTEGNLSQEIVQRAELVIDGNSDGLEHAPKGEFDFFLIERAEERFDGGCEMLG